MTPSTSEKTPKSRKAEKPSADEFIFEQICENFEERYGRGWKRRLAEKAGVPESNVHSWIKAGRMPPWILRIFRLLVQNTRLQREKERVSALIDDFVKCDQVIESDDGFAVYRFKDGLGKLIAKGIPDVETATEYASLPRLKALADKGTELVWELRENNVIPEDSSRGTWGREADEILELKDSWNRPAVLRYVDDEITVNALFENIAEALEALPDQMAS